ncbi:MAG: RluA family pseudouridine synthase [Alkalispirochaeta sp.]
MAELQVAADDEGRRLDRVLRNGFPNVPPGAIAGAIRRGDVRLNDRKVAGDTRVQGGDRISIPDWTATGREQRRPERRRADESHGDGTRPRDTRRRGAPSRERGSSSREPAFSPHLHGDELRAGHWSVSIIERTDDWLVLNKPPGLPAHGHEALDEIVRGVAAHEGWWRESVSFRPGPVHRLDAGTSGVQLFSLSNVGAKLLTEALRHRRVTKMYLAVTAGSLKRGTEIDRRLAYDRTRRTAVVEPESGQPPKLRFASARTVVYPVATTGDGRISLVAAFPLTGRTHQVRAHLAAAGLPLIGDENYGGPPWTTTASRDPRLGERKRMMLHALVLALENPATMWTAPLPSGDYHMVRSIFGDASGVVTRLQEILAIACTTCPRNATIQL